MTVKVNTGAVSPTDRPKDLPQDRWWQLVTERKYFLGRRLSHDCRCLSEFVSDAEVLWEPLGYSSAEDLIRNGYELDPASVSLAVEYLARVVPSEAISLEVAATKQREYQVAQLAHSITTEAAKEKTNGGNRNPEGINQYTKNSSDASSGQNYNCKSDQKEKTPLYGNNTRYLTERIARERPDIHERMKQGEFRSVRAAAIEAGIVPVKTKRPTLALPLDADAQEIAGILYEKFPDVDLLKEVVKRLQEALG